MRGSGGGVGRNAKVKEGERGGGLGAGVEDPGSCWGWIDRVFMLY